MSPASLGIVTFRRHPAGSTTRRYSSGSTRSWPSEIERQATCSSRRPGARPLRAAALHPQPLDVPGRGRPRARARRDARGRRPAAPPAPAARELPGDRAGWLGRSGSTARRSASLDALLLARRRAGRRVLATAREHARRPRRGIIEQWEVSRDLYVILTARSRSRPTAARRVARPGRLLRRARGDRLGRGLRAHPHGHGHRDEPTQAARPRLGARQLADEGRPRLRRPARAGIARPARCRLAAARCDSLRLLPGQALGPEGRRGAGVARRIAGTAPACSPWRCSGFWG